MICEHGKHCNLSNLLDLILHLSAREAIRRLSNLVVPYVTHRPTTSR